MVSRKGIDYSCFNNSSFQGRLKESSFLKEYFNGTGCIDLLSLPFGWKDQRKYGAGVMTRLAKLLSKAQQTVLYLTFFNLYATEKTFQILVTPPWVNREQQLCLISCLIKEIYFSSLSVARIPTCPLLLCSSEFQLTFPSVRVHRSGQYVTLSARRGV